MTADSVPQTRADTQKRQRDVTQTALFPTLQHAPHLARLTPTDMAVHKNDKADIRSRYPLYVQIGLALSLSLIIGAFTIPLMPGGDFEIIQSDQEIIEVEEIEQTQQLEKPPPPPAPPPPEEVPDEEIIEEQVIDISQDIDLSETPPAPPPPPPPPSAAPPPPPPPPPPEPEIFEVVEQMPTLIGGLEALQRAIQYPEMARRSGIEGRVFVQFVVDEQGRPSEVRAVRGIGGGADEAAVNAVRNARFTPGLQRGRPVKVRMSLPVTFRLN